MRNLLCTNDYQEIGYVFTIDRKKLKEYFVSEYNVSDIASIITEPDDKEVLLLLYPPGSCIPEEVITSIEKINPSDYKKCNNILNRNS